MHNINIIIMLDAIAKCKSSTVNLCTILKLRQLTRYINSYSQAVSYIEQTEQGRLSPRSSVRKLTENLERVEVVVAQMGAVVLAPVDTTIRPL